MSNNLGNKQTMAKNINKYMNIRGITRKEICNDLNIKYSTFSDWINANTYPRIDKIELLANYFGIEKSELVEEKSKKHTPTVNYIVVPIYAEICCGNGGFVEDNIIDYIPVPSELLNENGNYFCMVAKGDSMIEAGISPGDYLIFERCSKVDHNVIGCFCLEENVATCKKYKQLENGTIMLSPCNSNYDPIIIDMYNADNIRCIGVLRKSIRSY